MKSSIAQASMLLLDGTQLNLALGDVLAQAGIIQNRTHVHTYPANGNVMTTSLSPKSATDGWISSTAITRGAATGCRASARRSARSYPG